MWADKIVSVLMRYPQDMGEYGKCIHWEHKIRKQNKTKLYNAFTTLDVSDHFIFLNNEVTWNLQMQQCLQWKLQDLNTSSKTFIATVAVVII